jgi:uracil-DNA glycosylase
VSPSQQRALLGAMDIDVWVSRVQVGSEPDTVPPITDSPISIGLADADWEALRAEVAACTRCGLHRGRKQTVFGVGCVNAQWMFIGEAPGAEEDAKGEPFVGRAGKLLNNMLHAAGLKRESVYIANILKCRPPGNRDPQPEESAFCRSYLNQQITWIKPQIIIALGRIAAQNLLATDSALARLRGAVHTYEGVPLVVTYHPAYLLRSPLEKRKAWEDLQFAQRVLVQAASR